MVEARPIRHQPRWQAAVPAARQAARVASRGMVLHKPSYPVEMSEDEHLRSYLEAVDRLPPLTDSEVRELADAIKSQREADDLAADAEQAVVRRDAARKRLIEGNLRTVVVIAGQYRDQGLSLAGLLEVGNLGLVRAVHDFDWRRPSEFPGRATAAIHDALAAAVSGRE
jgi:DNA-directed RNA polymerase sigma subunit (sigma70/sigma32)